MKEEIKRAMFEMAPFKAPGVDGLHAGFYQNLWDIVDDSVVFKKYGIPHRLDVGFPPSFSPIKRGSLSSLINTSPHPLKVICSITQLFWVFTFCLNFLGN